MDRRLLALAILAPLCVVGSRISAVPGILALVLVPAAALAWAAGASGRAWSLVMALGGAAVALAAPTRFADWAAGVIAGRVVWEALRRGCRPARALVWGVAPFAVWTVLLAVGGVQPFTAEVRESVDGFLAAAVGEGELSAASLAELRESSARAFAFLQRTWVASEAVWFWVSLFAAYAALRRLFRRELVPEPAPFTRLQLPDGVAWVFAGGLALVLGGDTILPAVLATVGWNVVLVAGFAYWIRGLAIVLFGLERAGLRWPARLGLVLGGAVLFLPLFSLVAVGLGLFDTWFDLRRLRLEEEADEAVSVFNHSSGDD